MGRPLKEPRVDESVIEDMAAIGCTVDDIGIILGLSDVTLRKRFFPLIEKGRARRRESLHKKQTELALAGDKTMLIWLGKQDLGQRDKSEVHEETTIHVEATEARQRLVAALSGVAAVPSTGAGGTGPRVSH